MQREQPLAPKHADEGCGCVVVDKARHGLVADAARRGRGRLPLVLCLAHWGKAATLARRDVLVSERIRWGFIAVSELRHRALLERVNSV